LSCYESFIVSGVSTRNAKNAPTDTMDCYVVSQLSHLRSDKVCAKQTFIERSALYKNLQSYCRRLAGQASR
jgi:hypothetical protein